MFGLTPYERKNSAMTYDPFKAFENFEREFFKTNGLAEFKTDIRDNGKEYELEVLSTLEYNGGTYMAVIPADAGEEGAELSLEVSILKSTEEDGEPLLTAIEDEEELRAVYDLIMEELYAEDETEEEDE